MKHLTQSKFMRMFTGLAVFGAMAFGAVACETDDTVVEDDPVVEEEPADEPADEGEDDTLEDDTDDA